MYYDNEEIICKDSLNVIFKRNVFSHFIIHKTFQLKFYLKYIFHIFVDFATFEYNTCITNRLKMNFFKQLHQLNYYQLVTFLIPIHLKLFFDLFNPSEIQFKCHLVLCSYLGNLNKDGMKR